MGCCVKNLGESGEGLKVSRCQGFAGSGERGVLQGMNEAFSSVGSKVGRRESRHLGIFREKFGSARDTEAVGVRYVKLVTSVMFQCRAHVPRFLAVRGPRGASVWSLMQKYASSGRSQRSAIEIENAVDLGMSGEFGVNTRRAQKVQSEFCLRNKLVPEPDWEARVSGAKAGDEVILPCADGTFSCVDAMVMRLNELIGGSGSDDLTFDGR